MIEEHHVLESIGHMSNPARVEGKYIQNSAYPTAMSKTKETGFVPARTTFHANKASDDRMEWFDRAWIIHHGLLPAKWRGKLAEKGRDLDEVDKGLRACPQKRDRNRVAGCILSELPDRIRQRSRSRFLRIDGNDIKRFNGHYAGVRGAVLSSCISVLEDDPKLPSDVTESIWYRDIIRPLANELDINPAGLIRMAHRIWGEGR